MTEVGSVAASYPAAPGVDRPTLQREHVFTSTIEICQRLLTSRRFHVKQGGVRVTASARYEQMGRPECSSADYHITLKQNGLLYDSEYGTCGYPQGAPVTKIWTQLPEGDYELVIWTNNTNPNCCLTGDIAVEQEAGLQGPTCTELPPGPWAILHAALEVAGLFPGLGAVPDAVNAGLYVIEGDWVNAGLSAAATVPVFGDAATAVRIGERTVVKVTGEAVEHLGQHEIAAGLKKARQTKGAAKKGGDLAAPKRAPGEGVGVDAQWGNAKSGKAYGHARSEHGAQRPPQQLKDRARTKGTSQGHFADDLAIVQAEQRAPLEAGQHIVTLDRPAGRVYHPDGTVTEGVSTVLVVRNKDLTVKTSYPFIQP